MVSTTNRLPLARPRRRRQLGRRFQTAGPGTYIFLIVVAAASAFPLYWSFVVASHDNAAVSEYPPVLTPGGQLWHNIGRLFNSGEVSVDFWAALTNSFIVALTVSVAVVFFSALAGFAFAKLEFRGSRMLLLAVVATMLVPVQLGVIPLYIEMKEFGWTNSLQAVTAPYLVTAFGVFRHVVWPAVRPVAAVLGLLTFMTTWNDFFWPLIVLSPQNPTVQVAVSSLASGYVEDFALVLTGTFISILPLLFVFLVLGRQIIGGIMQGAVKG